MRELRVTANGLNFRCLAAGPEAGELALLLHGFPEGAESWSAQLDVLGEAGFLAIAPDLRGYGGTDRPAGEEDYRLSHLIDDVEGLIAAFGRDRCHLAGHDWGSLVGWSFVSYRPHRALTWSALSVGHPDAFAETIRDDADQQQRSTYIELFLQREKAEEVLSQGDFHRIRGMYRAAGPNVIAPAQIERFVRSLARPGRLTAGLNYYRANLGGEAPREFPPAPHPIAVPSQLIWGDQDPALGAGQARLTHRHVTADYRLEVLEGAGHWLQFERPAEVARLLLEWIRIH
ncbi:MAG TPA: alpha/beta fold hydrolase [Candidatus Dormibacteraeota bacterium]|nr:alpha/beta fold hydrolase [Candidatus Dormibacteraeota bacterium]